MLVARQPGVGTARVRSLTVWVSYDDGAPWRTVPLESTSDGAVATLKHPTAAGFVSLRAAMTDTEGNTAEVTILRVPDPLTRRMSIPVMARSSMRDCGGSLLTAMPPPRRPGSPQICWGLDAMIDWSLMAVERWKNTDADPDRQRRRMAEFASLRAKPDGRAFPANYRAYRSACASGEVWPANHRLAGRPHDDGFRQLLTPTVRHHR